MARACTLMQKVLLLIIPLLLTATARADDAAPPVEQDSVKILAESRRFGWQLATTVIDSLERKPHEGFPGIKAWLDDYAALRKTIEPQTPLDKWPTIEVDKLLAHNPNFWRAYFEIAPADAGLELMHAGLLLAGGESSRALYLVVLEQYRPGTPKDVWDIYRQIAAHAQRNARQGRGLVQAGIKLFDAGDYAGAKKKYELQLKLWPQDGQAWYEFGFTRMTEQRIAAGLKPSAGGTLEINGLKHSPEVLELFANARLHDPFEWHAYQGSDPSTVNRALAMHKRCMPEWKKLAGQPAQVDNGTLDRFSIAAEEAGIDEMAIAARQILAARRGGYAPADHAVFATGLRKLAPGPAAETTLARLGASGRLAFEQLVVPEAKAVAPRPANAPAESGPATINQIVMYVPLPQLEERIGDNVEPMANYVKALQKAASNFFAAEKNPPTAKGVLIAVGVRSKSDSRVWCEAVDGELSPELQSRLEQQLTNVPAFDPKRPPMAFGIEMNLFGRKPDKYPGFPQLWNDTAREKKTTLSPPDELFQTIWPSQPPQAGK